MASSSKKRTPIVRHRRAVILTLSAAVVVAIVVLGAAQFRASQTVSSTAIPVLLSRPAYVDGSTATDQVANFYKQYIDARSSEGFRAKLIAAYGDKNLSFYSEYYQHGFDPITCSATMPTKVTARLVSTGSIAAVAAEEHFADGSKLTTTATVVLSDKLAIDSITCPGAMGNLTPAKP